MKKKKKKKKEKEKTATERERDTLMERISENGETKILFVKKNGGTNFFTFSYIL